MKFVFAGYKLSAFCYVNPVTNKGEIGGMNFLADEGGEAYRFAFESFKKSLNKEPPNILVDKDFNEISILKEVFPNTRILLCEFHVLKVSYFKIFPHYVDISYSNLSLKQRPLVSSF
jgi:hypothetical protein